MKKKVIATAAATAFALAAISAPAAAFPGGAAVEPGAPYCFGQVHRLINTEGALGFTNVGQVVRQFGGQGKNAIARGICMPTNG